MNADVDTVMPEEKLREVLDRVIRQVTEDSGGICLIRGDAPPGKDSCTVHIRFRRGFRSSLSLRVDRAMLTRLARSTLQEERVTLQDLEDVAKEYLNVLCGHIAAVMYRTTRIASRFDVPAFYHGTYSPEDQKEQFDLRYSAEGDGAAQLVHHIPVTAGDRAAPERGTEST